MCTFAELRMDCGQLPRCQADVFSSNPRSIAVNCKELHKDHHISLKAAICLLSRPPSPLPCLPSVLALFPVHTISLDPAAAAFQHGPPKQTNRESSRSLLNSIRRRMARVAYDRGRTLVHESRTLSERLCGRSGIRI